MASSLEGFVLLNLTGVTLYSRQSSHSQTGTLTVECISVPPDVQAVLDRNIFLILRINADEIPLDPRRTITLTSEELEGRGRTYIFSGTDSDPEELELYIPDITLGTVNDWTTQRREEVDTLDGILTEYANFRDNSTPELPHKMSLMDAPQNLRGHLVLVNEDSGEIIGEVDKKISVHEDGALSRPTKGHEHDPVIIEMSEEEEEGAIVAFARNIPADQQDWMTKSAKLVSQGISQTTNLLVNVISSASSYYIAHSSPSSRPSSSAASVSSTASTQSKAVAFISSSRTQSGLTHAHALSAQAVKISGKTLAVVDGMISKIIGAKDSAKGASYASNTPSSSSSPPPPYSSTPNPSINAKPPLPPRLGENPPLPPHSDDSAPPLPPRALNKKAKLILSADLILSTLDESAKQLLNVGSRDATRVVAHQYGAEAAQSTSLMAGTVRNVALVYIDLHGIGRKALVKRVAKQYVKSKFAK
ncbi:hypothetical protein GYMLUDRAFT_96048 [Collybiopsis luxurians FD-317 M1]|uniref:Senescence domain-containing protein n=1 Tax=Collybiopsis luxurians FD-317 M1 TaxID=944289 RepID=A0A0D0C2U6_9AGAR|nr:hypothetical protein GYMLUDRAFT_96048 [Collybiopsis luxurians FD-317 M1]